MNTKPVTDDNTLENTLSALRTRERERDFIDDFLYAEVRTNVIGVDAEPISIGRFELREFIGSGGMGAVFSAYDPKLDRLVALKRIFIDGVAERKRLTAEARGLARVRHPSVVTVFDVETEGQEVFLTMELLDGASIPERAHFKHWRDAVASFLHVLEGLQAAHAAGVIHGDIKPSNLVFASTERLVLIDFGLSHMIVDLKAERGTGGTPHYMSPLRKKGGLLTKESDVYSLLIALEEQVESLSPPKALSRLLEANRAKPESLTSDTLHNALSRLLRRPKWPYLAIGGPIAIACGFVGVAISQRAPEPSALELCERGAEQLLDSWKVFESDINERFARSEWKNAQSSQTRFGGQMEKYASTYKSLFLANCNEALAIGVQSPAQHEQSRQCFSQDAVAYEALINGVIGSPDDQVLKASLVAALKLPSLADCRVPHSNAVPLPEDANARANIENAFDDVARITSRIALGMYKESQPDVEELIKRSNTLGYDPLIAEALMLNFRLQSAASKEARSLEILEAVAVVANRGRSDILLAKTWIAAVIGAANQGLFTKANEYQERAQLAVERIGNPQRETLELHIARAIVLQKEGRYGEALAFAEKALAMRLELSDTDYAISGDETLIGTLHLDLGDPEAALHALQSAAKRLEAGVGAEHPATARTFHSIGDTLSDLGRSEEALSFYYRAAETMRNEFGESHLGLAITLGSIGLVELVLENYEEAEVSLRQSFAIKSELLPPDSPNLAFAHEQLGLLALKTKKYSDALAKFQTTLQIRLASLSERSTLIGYTRIRLGVAFVYLKKNTEAHNEFSLADSILTEQFGAKSPLLGQRWYQEAITLQTMGRFPEAIVPYLKAYSYWNTQLESSDPRCIEVNLGLAACYEATGDMARSEKHRALLPASATPPSQ